LFDFTYENDTLYIEDFASIHDTKKYKNPYYDEITSGYESLIKNHINDIAGYSQRKRIFSPSILKSKS
jgi:hypothetical protein